MRPLFLCRACGRPWPCATSRVVLLSLYRDNREGLRKLLSGRLMIAISDQPRIDPVALTTRFLGWLPPDDS